MTDRQVYYAALKASEILEDKHDLPHHFFEYGILYFHEGYKHAESHIDELKMLVAKYEDRLAKIESRDET